MVSRLPKILAIFALIFLLGALIIQQTVKGNRERVEIIENETRPTVTVTKPVTANGNGNVQNVQKPKNVTDASQTGIVTVTDVSEDILGEEVGKISVNDAIFEELDAVPGIGPKTAEKIINGRPWESLDDVLNLISKQWREEARGMLKL